MHRPVRVHHLAGAAAAEHVRSGVDRVGQDPGCAGVGEPAPADLSGPGAAVGAAGKAPPGERAGHAVGRPGCCKRGEHVGDRRGDLGVRVDDHVAFVVVDVADRQRHPQVAAAGGGPFRLAQPAGQQVDLSFRHLALEAQKEAVVDVGQVVDTVGVDDQGVGQAGQLQQPGQVGVGTSQPGDLQPEHCPDLAQAHPRDQVLEPVPVGDAAPGQPQVGVDDLDVATCISVDCRM